MKKGIAFSISATLIFSFILLFAIFFAEQNQKEETAILKAFEVQKAGFIAEDISSDLNTLLGTQIDANKTPDSFSISFFDQLPAKTPKTELIDYNSFVFSKYSNQQNAKITMNIDKLIDGKTELLFSNALQYDYDYSGTQSTVVFYSKTNDTNATSIDINVVVRDANLQSANPFGWACFASGTEVRLHFEDNFGHTVNSTCYHNPSILDQYVFSFENMSGSITVYFGSINGAKNSAKIQSTLQSQIAVTTTFIRAFLPTVLPDISYYYDADLNYSQADTSINKKIEIGRA